MLDLAKRVYDHSFRIDPIVRSLLDTDFYKLLMAQTILRRHPQVSATFGITNRTARVRIADEVDEDLLREQLDHARSLRLSKGEVTWLRGNVFRGQGRILGPEFVTWFENFRLPEYELATRDGQYELTFHGPWVETTMWEVPALAILNELRARAVLRGLGKLTLQVLYARAMTRVWGENRAVAAPSRPVHRGFRNAAAARLPVAGLVRAGDGRRLGRAALPRHVELPHRRAAEVEPVGTNAHELPMVYAPSPPTMRRSAMRPMPSSGLAGGLRGQPSHRPARHLRHDRLPGERRIGSRTGPASASIPRIRSRAVRRRSASGRITVATRATSSRSSPTDSTSRKSSASMPASTAGCASATAGARCSPTISGG